jgi:DNA-binding FadR family transcriptional regulator
VNAPHAPKVPARAPRRPSAAGATAGSPARSLARARPAERESDRVARTLLGRIVHGDYAVGAVLPREDELASELSATRGVVREAIKALEVHALVKPVRRRGTLVLDPFASLSAAVLRAMLVPEPGKVDRRVLASVLEIRAVLDEHMTALAAERRTKADVVALEACVARLHESVGDAERHAADSGELGVLLARASKNPLFVMLAAWNREVTSDLEHLFAVTRPATSSHVEAFELLVSLVRARDASGVREAVRAFHAWATPRVLAAANLHHPD